VRTLLCVPLTVFQRVIGCIYLDSTNAADRFQEDHLQLLTAIAGVSAVALDNARRVQWLEQENQRLTTEVRQEQSLVGEGARIKEIFQFLARVAPTESTVLIEGESGTGKELVARALHRNSHRAGKPFVAINCAAIPESLLESDLFGHERGAFTGAAGQKKGRLEVAEGGVVFLDEIGELAPALQVKLLRVLQEREFERVGGTHPIKIDIRLIAATNRDLSEAVRNAEFRPDLYYRLAVVKLTMPPLREHREDIPMLTRHFVQKYAKRSKVKAKPVSREAMAALVNYEWPGNVRELENAIERALVMGSSDSVLLEDLPESLLEQESPAETHQGKYHASVKELKKQLIIDAVEQTRGNYVEAAGILGVHPNYLHRLIRNLGLKESLLRERSKFSA
jgi:Nif-specific regulatory protein